jgi:hypothetical protein
MNNKSSIEILGFFARYLLLFFSNEIKDIWKRKIADGSESVTHSTTTMAVLCTRIEQQTSRIRNCRKNDKKTLD